MKYILVADDEEYKRKQVVEVVRSSMSDAIVTETRSLRTTLRCLLSRPYDLLVLDMTLPTYDDNPGEHSGRPQAFGGREVIRHLRRRRVPTPTVVVTQFESFGQGAEAFTLEELDHDLRSIHPVHYLGAIHYKPTSDVWQLELRRLVHSLMD